MQAAKRTVKMPTDAISKCTINRTVIEMTWNNVKSKFGATFTITWNALTNDQVKKMKMNGRKKRSQRKQALLVLSLRCVMACGRRRASTNKINEKKLWKKRGNEEEKKQVNRPRSMDGDEKRSSSCDHVENQLSTRMRFLFFFSFFFLINDEIKSQQCHFRACDSSSSTRKAKRFESNMLPATIGVLVGLLLSLTFHSSPHNWKEFEQSPHSFWTEIDCCTNYDRWIRSRSKSWLMSQSEI